MSSQKKRRGWRMPFTALDYTERLMECLDTPRALTCYLLLKYREYDQLARLEIQPSWYLDSEAFFIDAQATTILQKWDDLPSTIDRRAAAIRKFAECEALCRETNLRLRTSASTAEVEHVLHVAKSKIVRILGDAPTYDELPLRFGPGASVGVRGSDTSVYKKLTTGLECSFDMLAVLPVLRRSAPGWRELDTEHVSSKKGSELMFVPKNAKTDRPICIEPCINGFVQLGIGAYLKRRLRRYGVDLRDQGINQELARLASERMLATVDFSSASDTIAKQVIITLVPEPWVELLESCRCSSFLFEGRAYPLAKFSSMGNGYTFELESLIFYSIAVSCCTVLGVPYVTGENLHVFGDDVILPREAFPLFEKVCSYLGFKINREKTYTEGLFFESCGKDYFDGVLVRPYHHKKHRSLRDVFRLTNVTLQLANRTGKRSLYKLHRWCVARIERRHRCYVPEGFEDYGLVAPLDIAHPSVRRVKPLRGWFGYLFKGLGEGSLMAHPPKEGWPLSYVSYMAYLAPFGDDCKVVASKGYFLRGEPRPKWGWFTTWTWPCSLTW